MSSPHFICIPCNEIICDLVPGVDCVDMTTVGDFLCIRSDNVLIGWNVEWRSIAKLLGVSFDFGRKCNTVARDQVKVSKVLLGSFVKENVFL